MWKARTEDKPVTVPTPAAGSPAPGASVSAAPAPRPAPTPRAGENFRGEMAHIGKSVLIKGELSGSEDLYLDGEVEGNVDLKQHCLTIGPHGRVRANLRAREIVVHGKVDGNISGEKVELKKSAILMGDISTQRIVIEEGAYFKGAIDIQKEPRGDNKREIAVASTPGSALDFSEPAMPLLEKKI